MYEILDYYVLIEWIEWKNISWNQITMQILSFKWKWIYVYLHFWIPVTATKYYVHTIGKYVEATYVWKFCLLPKIAWNHFSIWNLTMNWFDEISFQVKLTDFLFFFPHHFCAKITWNQCCAAFMYVVCCFHDFFFQWELSKPQFYTCTCGYVITRDITILVIVISHLW